MGIKVWDVSSIMEDGSSMETDKNGLGATTLDPIKMVAVAFWEAIVKLFDIEAGLECSKLNSNISYSELGHYQLDYH